MKGISISLGNKHTCNYIALVMVSQVVYVLYLYCRFNMSALTKLPSTTLEYTISLEAPGQRSTFQVTLPSSETEMWAFKWLLA